MRGFVEALASKGRCSFTSGEARQALKTSADASRQALHRLAKQGRIASPSRGFYVIVPPEYRSLGCLPAEQFIPELMGRRGWAYYAGLLTAAQYYGAAHQRPQAFQVLLQKNSRPIHCGKVRVQFIARKGMAQVAVRLHNTACGQVRASAPEATAIDLVGYPEHVGGLGQAATVLAELADEMDPLALAEAAATAPITWAQRLGYLLELVGQGHLASAVKSQVRSRAPEYTRLVPSDRCTDGQRLIDWKLIVNARLAPDL